MVHLRRILQNLGEEVPSYRQKGTISEGRHRYGEHSLKSVKGSKDDHAEYYKFYSNAVRDTDSFPPHVIKLSNAVKDTDSFPADVIRRRAHRHVFCSALQIPFSTGLLAWKIRKSEAVRRKNLEKPGLRATRARVRS